MNGAAHNTIPEWMRASILNCKSTMPDRVILRAIKQEEILSIALAVHKARVERRTVPEIQDGVLRDRAGALGYWLDLKLKTDNVPKDRAHNFRFSCEVSGDLQRIEDDQRMRDALGLPLAAGLRDIDNALAEMSGDDRSRFLNRFENVSAIETRSDTFAITAAIRGQTQKDGAYRPGPTSGGHEARAPQVI